MKQTNHVLSGYHISQIDENGGLLPIWPGASHFQTWHFMPHVLAQPAPGAAHYWSNTMQNIIVAAGYRAFNGHVFTQAQAERYNERCQYSELVKHLRGEDSAFYQNALKTQHMTFCVITGIAE